jgi:hypothetical protein
LALALTLALAMWRPRPQNLAHLPGPGRYEEGEATSIAKRASATHNARMKRK